MISKRNRLRKLRQKGMEMLKQQTGIVKGMQLWGREITEGMQCIGEGEAKFCIYPDAAPNLYTALVRTSERLPEKIGIVDDDGHAYCYSEILRMTRELASYLYFDKGIKQGAHAGLMMHNRIEFCIAFFALSALSAVAVPLPSKFKRKEVLSLSERADVSLVICEEEYADWFSELLPEEKIISVTEKAGEYGFAQSFLERRKGDCRERDAEAEPFVCSLGSGAGSADALIMFTSGTTSMSKGVLLKNDNLMQAVESYRRILHITEADISVLATPIYHITGLIALLGLFVTAGGRLHLHRLFDAKRVLDEARRFSFTFIHASPTVFHLLLQEGENTPEIPSLRSFACGSSNMMKDKLLRLHSWLPNSSFHTVYGLTETSSPAAIFPGDAASSKYIGSSGLPIPGTEFKIVDECGEPLPKGSVGEIAVRGSVVLEKYYRQSTDNLRDGWLYTGDLGYFNEENYLYVVDRKKNMINRGGEKIWCYDVENEISSMEGVEDAAVVGIPDDVYGEVAAAAVQCAEESGLTAETITQYLRNRIAKYKIPVKFLFLHSIPQTANGKPDKNEIRRLLTEEKS